MLNYICLNKFWCWVVQFQKIIFEPICEQISLISDLGKMALNSAWSLYLLLKKTRKEILNRICLDKN
jgi:hypothetical protein